MRKIIENAREYLNIHGDIIVSGIIVAGIIGGVVCAYLALLTGAFTCFLLSFAIGFWFWATKRDEVSGLFQAIAAIILVGITIFYAGETAKMALLMTEAQKIELRPYLSIEPAEPLSASFNDKGELIFRYKIKNTGKTPAINVKKGHALYVLKNNSNEFDLLKGPTVELKQRHFVPPAEEFPLIHPDVVGYKNDIDKISVKSLRLALRVTYTSASEAKDKTDFTIACIDLHPISGPEGKTIAFNVAMPFRHWGMNEDIDFSFCQYS